MKVAVLGAGVIGVSTAYHLARAGADVVVLERREGPALGTSFANAGQVSPGYSSPWATPLPRGPSNKTCATGQLRCKRPPSSSMLSTSACTGRTCRRRFGSRILSLPSCSAAAARSWSLRSRCSRSRHAANSSWRSPKQSGTWRLPQAGRRRRALFPRRIVRNQAPCRLFLRCCSSDASGEPFSEAMNRAYRSAIALALGAAGLLVWLSLGIGIIGADGDPANRMYFGVLAVGFCGVALARFRPRGMARALFATAFAQTAVAVIALVAGLGLPWSLPAEIVLLTAFFVALFVASGWLFVRSTRGRDR